MELEGKLETFDVAATFKIGDSGVIQFSSVIGLPIGGERL